MARNLGDISSINENDGIHDTSFISNENEHETINSYSKKAVSFHLRNFTSESDSMKSAQKNYNAGEKLYEKIIKSMENISFENNAADNSLSTNRNSINSRNNLYKRKKLVNIKAIKLWTYMMLEKPIGHLAFIHRIFTFSIILITIIFSAFTTMEPIKEWSENILFYIELFVTVYFFIEYLLRLWSSDCLPAYRGIKRKFKFMLRPIMVIELFAFIFGVIIIIGSSHTRRFSDAEINDVKNKNIYFGPIALTILRFLQLVRLLYVDRKAQTWIILLDVCNKHKFELMSSVYIGFITLLLSSYLIYHCEKSVPDSLFRTYSDAVYWSIITMTTIGYGDISPKTFYGKIIATGLCVLGVAFWTLPGGIIGSGFAFTIAEKNKIKKFNRLVPVSAYLIQSWWRQKVLFDIPTDNPSALLAVLKAFEPIDENNNNLKSRQNKKLKNQSNSLINNDENNFITINNDNENESLLLKDLQSENLTKIFRKIRPKTVIMIRTISLLKFFVAKNKFKSAHKPYDFKDVIDQYTKGNMLILMKIKELQRKLDQTSNNTYKPITQRSSINFSTNLRNSKGLQRQLSFHESTTNQTERNSKISLEHRIDTIESKIDQLLNLHFNNLNNNNNNNDKKDNYEDNIHHYIED